MALAASGPVDIYLWIGIIEVNSVVRPVAVLGGPVAQSLEEPRHALPSHWVESSVVELFPGDLEVDESGRGKFGHEPDVLLAEGGQLGHDQVMPFQKGGDHPWSVRSGCNLPGDQPVAPAFGQGGCLDVDSLCVVAA